MDPISQGAVGAIVAASAAPAREVRLAVLVGWVAGMMADLDVLIRSEEDSLLSVEYHRHFTHALIFAPVGGLIAAGLFWLLLRRRTSFARLYLYGFLGYATAGLLDACTSYGTRLLWPFSDARVAWNIISIIDPVFTGTILMLIIWAVARRKRAACAAACGFALAYLLFGVLQNRSAMRALKELAEARGHQDAARFTAKPSIGNLAVWRGIYESGGYIHVDAIRVPYFGGATAIYPGDRTPKVDVAALRRELPEGSALGRDLARFDHFSDGYLSWHPERSGALGDARYAMLPDSIDPLWGIEIDLRSPDERARFVTFRNADRAQMRRLWRMVTGEEEPQLDGAPPTETTSSPEILDTASGRHR